MLLARELVRERPISKPYRVAVPTLQVADVGGLLDRTTITTCANLASPSRRRAWTVRNKACCATKEYRPGINGSPCSPLHPRKRRPHWRSFWSKRANCPDSWRSRQKCCCDAHFLELRGQEMVVVPPTKMGFFFIRTCLRQQDFARPCKRRNDGGIEHELGAVPEQEAAATTSMRRSPLIGESRLAGKHAGDGARGPVVAERVEQPVAAAVTRQVASGKGRRTRRRSSTRKRAFGMVRSYRVGNTVMVREAQGPACDSSSARDAGGRLARCNSQMRTSLARAATRCQPRSGSASSSPRPRAMGASAPPLTADQGGAS